MDDSFLLIILLWGLVIDDSSSNLCCWSAWDFLSEVTLPYLGFSFLNFHTGKSSDSMKLRQYSVLLRDLTPTPKGLPITQAALFLPSSPLNALSPALFCALKEKESHPNVYLPLSCLLVTMFAFYKHESTLDGMAGEGFLRKWHFIWDLNTEKRPNTWKEKENLKTVKQPK